MWPRDDAWCACVLEMLQFMQMKYIQTDMPSPADLYKLHAPELHKTFMQRTIDSMQRQKDARKSSLLHLFAVPTISGI